MFNPADLVVGDRYLIQGERGEWHYSGIKGDKYDFWRQGVNSIRRIKLALSTTQVKRRVWKEVQSLNLSNLEAMRGE